MIPIVAGLLMGAAMGGGIAALQGKDVLKGALLGGAGGALGGILMPAAGGIAGATEGVAAGAVGEGVGATANALGNVGATELTNAGIMNAGGNLTPTGAAQFMGSDAGFQLANPAATGTGGMFSGGIGNFLTANKGALTGGALGGMMAPGEKPPSPEQGNIREFDFNQGERNPLFGNPGENYYTSSRGFTEGAVTPVEEYDKANGGIIALAEGGEPGIEMQRYSRPIRTLDPAVAAYNAQIMERANQEYNINRRPGPNQVPGSLGYVAPPPPKVGVAKEYTDLINGPKKDSGMSSDDMYRDRYYDYSNSGGGPDGGNASDGNADGGPDGGNADGGPDGGNASGGLMPRDLRYNEGGISSLGNYSDGGQLLKGPGDGVSDSIPARIGARQPARLADGEFVVPARTVSELGNGSTDAGARQLYKMMDRVQSARKKSIGKGKVAVDSKARKMLPA
jgi:hypothetical protein